MKSLLILIPILTFLNAVDGHSNFSIQKTYYNKSVPESQIHGNTYIEAKQDKTTSKIDVDYRFSSSYDKQYINLKEFYTIQEYKDYLFSIGKVIKHWGELEGFNITDVYNQKNYLADPFNKDEKIGKWSLSASKYSKNQILELGMKFYEANQKLPHKKAPYSPIPVNYNRKLQLEDSRKTPTVYARYTVTTDDNIESDTSFIVQSGYDNKRYFSPKDKNTLVQNAYRANKYMIHSNVNYNDTFIKGEASYTDVINNKVVSDYHQVAVGVEKTVYDIIGMDVGLYTEYYKYKYKEKKLENQDMSEVYNNDVFLAMKVNLNDVGNTELKAGVLVDLDSSEKIFKVELKSRIKDKVVLKGEVLKIKDAKNSLLSNFKDTTRTNFDATYNF